MFCKNCDKEIAVGNGYYKYSDNVFCSSDCVTDFMIYNGRLAIKINSGDEDEEE